MSYKKYKDIAPDFENESKESYSSSPNVLAIKSFEEKKHLVERNRLCVVDVWKNGCPPCKTLAPQFNKMALKYGEPGKVVFISEDVSLGISPSVKSVPTVQFFFEGRLVNVIVGPDIQSIENKIQQLSQ